MKTIDAPIISEECADDACLAVEARAILVEASMELRRIEYACKNSEMATAIESAKNMIIDDCIPEIDVAKDIIDSRGGEADDLMRG